jgi:hypothetical protein
MSFGYNNPTKAAALFQVLLAAANSRFWITNLLSGQQDSVMWDGYMVMPAGEQLRVQVVGAASGYFTASGYQFALP